MMKKYVDERYVDIILQLAHKYQNENRDSIGEKGYSAMGKTLETMDKYVSKINRMGYMMYDESITAMIEYVDFLMLQGCEFSSEELLRVYNHLNEL